MKLGLIFVLLVACSADDEARTYRQVHHEPRIEPCYPALPCRLGACPELMICNAGCCLEAP